MRLSELKIGESAVVTAIKLKKKDRERLFSFGIREGVLITVVRKSLFGSPTLVKISDFFVALQEKTLFGIEVER